MSNIIETFTKNGVVLEIHIDESSESPREWDNLGKMVCFHNRYTLGDKHDINHDSFDSWEELEAYLRKTEKAIIILPLYLMDHSGLSISVNSFNDPWDSGQIGFIYVTKDKLKAEQKTDKSFNKKRAKNVLINEVETYDQYLRGDVYSFIKYKEIKCGLGETHKEIIDSVCGFYGHDFKNNGLFEHAEWKE